MPISALIVDDEKNGRKKLSIRKVSITANSQTEIILIFERINSL